VSVFFYARAPYFRTPRENQLLLSSKESPRFGWLLWHVVVRVRLLWVKVGHEVISVNGLF
jgi:hypothetical protein